MMDPPSATVDWVIVDTMTGARGDHAHWVRRFAEVWAAPRQRLDQLMALLSPGVVLKAPTRPAKTIGHVAARQAFQQTFDAMPDLRAEIERWSACGDVLFIEMTFRATIGGREVAWRSVDRILFRNGAASERTAFFDPARVRRAFLRNPTALRQMLRLRLGI